MFTSIRDKEEDNEFKALYFDTNINRGLDRKMKDY